MIIYLNGDYLDHTQTGISVTDRGFALGDGIFETMFYDGQEVECIKPHFDRLMKGAALFDIPCNLTLLEFKSILLNVVKHNGWEGQGVSLRFTLTRGPGERGVAIPKVVSPTVLVTAQPYQRRTKLLRVGFSQYCFQQPAILSGIKHLGYQLPILGYLEASHRGLDDVLFFNASGYLVCATVANVFILKDKEFITPPLADGCLPGIMRGKVIQEMQKNLKPVRIDHITRQDVEESTRLFLTNSLIGFSSAVLDCGG